MTLSKHYNSHADNASDADLNVADNGPSGVCMRLVCINKTVSSHSHTMNNTYQIGADYFIKTSKTS